MALASSSLTAIRYVPEATFGVTPTTGSKALRFTGESLEFSAQSESSKEIRPDRQTTDLIRTGVSAGGDINFEMSYKEYDPLIEAALQGTYAFYGTDGLGSTLTLDLDSVAHTLTADIAPTGSSAFTALVKGQWFKLSAPGDAADGTFLKVSMTVAPTSTVITLDASTPLPGAGVRAAVADCTLTSSLLTNGTLQRTFSIEKAFTDVGQHFNFRGMAASKMALNFSSAAIATGSFSFMGKDAQRGNTTFHGAVTASQTDDVVNTVSGVGNVLEDGVALSNTFIKSLNFTVDNNIRGQQAIGVLGNAGIASGSVAISGQVEIYLADGTIYDKFLNQIATSLQWTWKDVANQGYALILPKVKYGDAKVSAGSINQDVMLSIPFTALMDTTAGVVTTNKMIAISRL